MKNIVTSKAIKKPQVSSALYFTYNTALGPPYRVLVDTNFINFSIQNKLDLEKAMMDCLYAKCTPCITDCVMAELEKLGLLRIHVLRDCHVYTQGTYADDCIVDRVTQHKCYIVATCDRDLKRRIRKIPGVPIMYITQHKYSIERMPEATIGGVGFFRLCSLLASGNTSSTLNEVSFSLPEKSFGLIFGQSGSGKTTLLQLLAGLSEPTSGSIGIQRYGNDGNPCHSPEPLPPEKVGIVFQFPERYFVADTILNEVIFGWPRLKGSLQLKERLALNLQKAITWVGLNGISLEKDPHSLSGGYKRRLALAIQLVQVPDLLILDEPLAGLDWKARADVINLLKQLKKELTVLVVSHDLKELAALVDHSWRMEMGGYLKEELLPI
ncbi:hypothetical protein GH714_031908 [Hevea brasiliensis]|uniref:ABC transporter domain-containing protein n=1 Tax=Hevea brasiliensis TaxID=3981 RepID=A0A6A6NBS4_HEVBR|nr:hypothetical protein GH714_031908 [Hevea brasiliensis]